MSKADKALEKLGFTKFTSPFDDWYSYGNFATGVSVVFMDDWETIEIKGEVLISKELLQAITLKTQELGWLDDSR